MSRTKALAAQDLATFFRVPVYIPVDYDGRELLLSSRISNIGQNGMFITSPKPLPVGSALELRFQLPGVRELIAVQGVVRWSRGSPASERPVSGTSIGMGIEYVDLGRKQRAAIKDFIKRFIVEMRHKR